MTADPMTLDENALRTLDAWREWACRELDITYNGPVDDQALMDRLDAALTRPKSIEDAFDRAIAYLEENKGKVRRVPIPVL